VKYFTYAWIPLLLFYIYQISNYLPRFQNQFTFWENAVKDSPNSSYANNILAARYVSDKRIKEALPLFQKAYALNKAERYCRYFIAKEYYLPMDSVDKAISLIKEEIEINPTYVEAYFELSHIYYLQNNLSESVKYLEKCKQLRPDDPMINNNLLLTYIKLKNKAAAAQLSKFMLSKGMTVPDAALQDIEKME
jgi:tetratricopeptide (TPR) repeat protein